jgi:diadenosine tetraphosphate (Ap4A) HIT family hydrolase
MKRHFNADKTNVGALGNMVSQLHIHIIARFKKDAAWPHSLWQENVSENPYTIDEREILIQQLRVAFS